jgi:predicted ArsR family transcriptional regulator
MLDTCTRIWNLISQKPMTKTEISKQLNISQKTVQNRLGEIHQEWENKSKRTSGRRFVVFKARSGDGYNRSYGILHHSQTSATKRANGRTFRKQAGRSEYEYPTIIYKA